FAALEPAAASRWFSTFVARLLEGSPEVLSLLASNPFDREPPRYIRALLYDYRFSSVAERRATGAWWSRDPLGLYLAPAMLWGEEERLDRSGRDARARFPES